jgi:phage I-like protein
MRAMDKRTAKDNALYAIALAACTFALPALDDASATVEIQLTPAGVFRPSDNRPMTVDAWRIDAAVAARVIERFKARTNDPVLDYEHQTLNAETNGQPAPAAGWIKDLVWHEGRGLFAVVELTQRARALIAAKEYRYVSPVFRYDNATGDVLAIEMAALTNNPAIDGMEPLALRAAATFGAFNPQTDQESSVNKIHLAIATALALGATATEDQVIAAATAAIDERNKLRDALGVKPDVGAVDAIAACTALRAAKPDPSQFVPLAQFETVKAELAVLTKKTLDAEVTGLVEKGLAEGRLLPAQKDWAMDLGRTSVASLTQYLDSTQPIAALSGMQTQGKPPGAEGNGAHGLTDVELAVCTATGVKPEDFAAAKKVAA